MTLSGRPQPPSADWTGEVESAAAALVISWSRAQESLLSRVSPSQLRALLVVELHGTTNLNQLADELGAIPSSASRLCDRLVAAGLLSRRAGVADRREVALSLSSGGQRLLAELRAARRTELDRVLAAMPGKAREALLTGLVEFRRAAERLGPDGGATQHR